MSNEHEKRDNENYAKNFTRVCNIVLDSYKHLTYEEKYLYIKMRSVYWDAKPRFATLREISHLTGYAISALSRILPRLHTCGLVHAEIKQEYNPDGSKKGKPKYYISIPDIWELNRKYYECSPEERFDPSVVLLENKNVLLKNENVLQKNDNVLQENDVVPPREHFSPPKASSVARSQAPKDNKDINKDTYKIDSMCGDRSVPQPFVAEATPTHSLSSQSCLSSEETKPKEKSLPRKKEKKAETVEPKGPPEMPPADMPWGTTKCKLMFDAWRGHTLIANYKIMEASKCAKGLAEQFTEEEVRRVYQVMSEDTYWKERGGPDICNVANNIDKELKKMKSGKKVKQSSSHGTASHDGYTREERLALLKMTQEERRTYNQKRREARERAMEVNNA